AGMAAAELVPMGGIRKGPRGWYSGGAKPGQPDIATICDEVIGATSGGTWQSLTKDNGVGGSIRAIGDLGFWIWPKWTHKLKPETSATRVLRVISKGTRIGDVIAGPQKVSVLIRKGSRAIGNKINPDEALLGPIGINNANSSIIGIVRRALIAFDPGVGDRIKTRAIAGRGVKGRVDIGPGAGGRIGIKV